MVLHPKFINVPIVEAAEFGRQAAERANECELRPDDLNDDAEVEPGSGLEIAFSFRLQVIQPVSRCEAQRDQVNLTIGHKQQVASFLSQIERALHHRGRGLDRMGPWQDVVADDAVDLAAKTREILSLHKRGTQTAEAEPVAVVAEAGTDRHAQLRERYG